MNSRLLENALARRAALLERLAAEGTDCYRLFHGVAEGRPGLAIDRYGPVLLFQTWREPLTEEELRALHLAIERALDVELLPVWNHRSRLNRVRGQEAEPFSRFHDPELPEDPVGRELGLLYDVRPRHRGQDPLLFLDFRCGRRRVRDVAAGKSVLNLFAYTCGVGLSAAASGATEVWNVDFSRSALELGERNFARNDVDGSTSRFLAEDFYPVLRQLASLPVARRRGATVRRFTPLEPRRFDLVVLDPPRWSKGRFGAVDIVSDYPALLKPALLATETGGHVLATHNASEVSLDAWLRILERTGEKCGRPLRGVEVLRPEDDFPSFDGAPPLKVAWMEV